MMNARLIPFVFLFSALFTSVSFAQTPAQQMARSMAAGHRSQTQSKRAEAQLTGQYAASNHDTAVGYRAEAVANNGNASLIANGDSNMAQGDAVFALGGPDYSTASGYEGDGDVFWVNAEVDWAVGDYAAAAANYTQASGKYTLAQGRYGFAKDSWYQANTKYNTAIMMYLYAW